MALIRRTGGALRFDYRPGEMFAPEEHFVDWPCRGDSLVCHSFTNMMMCIKSDANGTVCACPWEK